MRRILLPLFVLTLAIGLVACDDSGSSKDSSTDTKTSTPDATGAAGAVGDAVPGEATEGASACEKTSTCDKADGEACVCAKGKDGAPVWCASCKKGYVDGKEVCCPKCVQRAIDKAAAAGGTE